MAYAQTTCELVERLHCRHPKKLSLIYGGQAMLDSCLDLRAGIDADWQACTAPAGAATR